MLHGYSKNLITFVSEDMLSIWVHDAPLVLVVPVSVSFLVLATVQLAHYWPPA